MKLTSISIFGVPILLVLLINGKSLESHTFAIDRLKIKDLREIRVKTPLYPMSVWQSAN